MIGCGSIQCLRASGVTSLLLAFAVGCQSAAEHVPTVLRESGACSCPTSFASLAERADPAVVFIETVQESGTESGAHGLGSGFVIDEAGVVLTNNHVIRGARDIHVVLRDNRFKAEVVGRDPPTDIAVLRIRGEGLPVLPLCPFVKGWIGKHPEYSDLVYASPASTAKD